MTDRDALYRAIVAYPDEDVPRLAFADAVEEDGEADYAEFIRSQCELARLEEDGSDSQAVYEFLAEQDKESLAAADWSPIDAGIARRVELARRVKDLLRAHEVDWKDRLALEAGMKAGPFHRGFPATVTVDAAAIQPQSAELLRTTFPGFTLACSNLDRRAADVLIESGLLRSISGLRLSGTWVDALRTLSRCPDVTGIRTLYVQGWDPPEQVAQTLANGPHWSGLRHLDLSSMYIPSDSAKELFRAERLRGLTRLMMSGSDWGADAVYALADAKFPSLVELRLTNAGLTDEHAEVLAASANLGRLRTLDVRHNQIGGRGASAILASRRLSSLAYVSFQSNAVRGLDRAMLADAPAGGLRVFHGHGCHLTIADVRALTRSPRFDALWYLDLDENQLGSRAVREVLRGLGKRCPPILWMIKNRIGVDGARLIADWPHAPRLQVLMLQGNDVTADGVAALLASRGLEKLRGLGVSGATEPLTQLLRERFGVNALLT